MTLRPLRLALAVLLGACGAPRPAATLFPAPLMDARGAADAVPDAQSGALIARARAYEGATGSFSAQVAVTLRALDRGQTFAARGAVAVRRPDAMRMQLTGPGGITALDVLTHGGTVYSRVAGRAWQHASLAAADPAGGVPAGAIARAFLGLEWSRARVVRLDDGQALARVGEDDGGAAWVVFDANDGAVREVRWLDAREAEQARVRFTTLEAVGPDGARFPTTVLYWQRAPRVTATFVVQQRVRAPSLPDATFAVPDPR